MIGIDDLVESFNETMDNNDYRVIHRRIVGIPHYSNIISNLHAKDPDPYTRS